MWNCFKSKVGEMNPQPKDKKPIIVAAAVKYPGILPDGSDFVLVSIRHWDDISNKTLDWINTLTGGRIDKADIDQINPPVQGFVDQYQTFYTRKEAYDLVMVNKQPLIKDQRLEQGLLYSENLYI